MEEEFGSDFHIMHVSLIPKLQREPCQHHGRWLRRDSALSSFNSGPCDLRELQKGAKNYCHTLPEPTDLGIEAQADDCLRRLDLIKAISCISSS